MYTMGTAAQQVASTSSVKAYSQNVSLYSEVIYKEEIAERQHVRCLYLQVQGNSDSSVIQPRDHDAISQHAER
jgi:hypothetical protein